MSRHDLLLTLKQIVEFARLAEQLGREGSREQLETDWKYRFAAELIGEAITRLPLEFRNCYPQVPWREVIGFRNRLIHGYDGMDYEILWDVLSCRASDLVEQVTAILAHESNRRGD